MNTNIGLKRLKDFQERKAAVLKKQEDFRLRTGNYLTAAADIAAIEAAIGWTPRNNNGTTYSIAAGPGDTYQVTATDTSGVTVCVRLPDDVRC